MSTRIPAATLVLFLLQIVTPVCHTRTALCRHRPPLCVRRIPRLLSPHALAERSPFLSQPQDFHLRSGRNVITRSANVARNDVEGEEECVTEVTSAEMFESILEHYKDMDTLIILELYADWCRKCKFMLPKFDKECEVQPEVLFIRMNTKVDLGYIQKTLGPRGLPSFMLFRHGERIDSFYANSQDIINEYIQDNL